MRTESGVLGKWEILRGLSIWVQREVWEKQTLKVLGRNNGVVHRTDWARDCFVLMISHEASVLTINKQPKPSIVGELDIAEQLKPSL